MKFLEFGTNRAIRFFKIAPSSGQVLYGVNLSRAFEARYGFLQGPRAVQEFDLASGITFYHGFFQNRVVDRIQVFGEGILAEAKDDTDLCDAWIDDAVSWAKVEAGLTFEQAAIVGRPYISQLIFEMDAHPGRAFEALTTFSLAISELVASYGLPDFPAEVTGINIQTDSANSPGWTYRFERRVGAPFSENKFFSEAPLRTSDHLKLLEDFERRFISPTA